MADFKDKNTGTLIRKTTFTDLSSSFASSEIIDGRKFEHITGSDVIKRLPYRLVQGRLNEIFPGLKDTKNASSGRIDTASGIYRDTERNIVYIPIRKDDYLLNRIGPGSKISSSFGANAYLQISRSYAEKFSNVPDDTRFLFSIEEFYSASEDSSSAYTTSSFNEDNVGATVAIMEMRRESTAFNRKSYSAIDNSVGVGYNGSNYDAAQGYKDVPRFIVDYRSSSFATHWDMNFTQTLLGGDFYSADLFFPTAAIIFHGNTPGAQEATASIALEEGEFISPVSGTKLSTGTVTNINPNDASDGGYVSYKFKTRIAGDADSGSLYTFPGDTQVIIYSSSLANAASGSLGSAKFQYHATRRNDATGSTTIKTLYFYTGSSNDILPDYHFYITGAEGNDQIGAPMHKGVYLTENADVGFYSPSGSQYSSSFLVQTMSGVTNGGPVFAQYYEAGN